MHKPILMILCPEASVTPLITDLWEVMPVFYLEERDNRDETFHQEVVNRLVALLGTFFVTVPLPTAQAVYSARLHDYA